ncbi:MAG TPA: hypothetical protein VFG58_00250 [Solirubrobacterales bacterium]|nr:hypothetical protein [Solirubrobacterales bacterium]
MRRLLGAVLLALCAGLAALALPAAAAPPRPAELSVVGGEGWHAENLFSLTWSAPAAGQPAPAAVHYRVSDVAGAVLGEGRRNWSETWIGPLETGRLPGAYTAEIWFEDAAGAEGPAATVPLRFDDTRPGGFSLAPLQSWIGRTDLPLRIRLGRPTEPLPPAGIRGYAAAVDADPRGFPCATPDRCSAPETTLSGGTGDDELTIAEPPEGTSYLHVAAVSGSGMASPASHAVLHVDRVDPVTRLAGAPPGWTNRGIRLEAIAGDSGSGMEASGDGPRPFTAIRIDGGAPAIAFGNTAAASVIAEGAHRVAYYARDAAGNVDDGATVGGTGDHAPRVTWVRIDRTPPRAAFRNSQDPRDPELIRARIADRLSGADTGRGWIGVRRAGSGDAYQRLPAAPPADGELRARWDSDAAPPGGYEFAALAYDAAGNSTLTTTRADGSPMVLANPLKATTRLRGAFRRGLGRTVRYGQRIRIRGRLIAGVHTPLAGAPVRVLERFAPGAHPGARESTVRTDPAGRFSFRTPRGPSRTIELLYPGSRTLRRSAARTLRLRVRGRVRLRASSGSATVGGRPLVFRGRVVAAPGTIPSKGMPVRLQFRLGRSPWSAFRTIQTDGRGRFRYSYRFSDDDSRGARFQFRAYVPAEENWPYAPAGSRPVLVTGR